MKTKFLSIICLFLSVSCISSPKIQVEKSSKKYPGSDSEVSPLEGLFNLQLNNPIKSYNTETEKHVSNFISNYNSNNIDEAISSIYAAYNSSGTEVFKDIYIQMMFNYSRWDQLKIYNDSLPKDDKIFNSNVFDFWDKNMERYTFNKSSFTVPMEINRYDNALIEIDVNGVKRKFIFDTGAELTILASDVAEEAGIKPITDEYQANLNNALSIDVASIDRLKIGELEINNHPALIVNENELEFKVFNLFTVFKIDGILGWNAIRNLNICMDYPNKIYTIKEGIKDNFKHTKNEMINIFKMPVVKVFNNNVELNMIVDTGSTVTNLTTKGFNKLKKGRDLNNDVTAKKVTNSIIGHQNITSSANVINNFTMSFADVEVQFNSIESFDLEVFNFIYKFDGVIGGDFFSKGVFTIDGPNRSFKFEI